MPDEVFAEPASEVRRLSRSDAATRLAVSARTLSRLEDEGRLRGMRDDHGRVWFDGDEVEQLALERAHGRGPEGEGARAQRAFTILRAGGDARRIVEELGVAPAAAMQLFRSWSELGSCIVVEPEQARRIAMLLGTPRCDLATVERALAWTVRVGRALSTPCGICRTVKAHERMQALEAGWTCGACCGDS
jgi:hypothetical protein